MNAKNVLESNMQMADFVLASQTGDLSDGDLLIRVAPAANHGAWQLGHLISVERRFVEGLRPGACPPLPEGFDALHAADQASNSSSGGYLKKQQYLDLHKRQRAATVEILQSLSENDLGKESPEAIRKMAPTIAHVFALLSLHEMWHIGQLTVLRRHLGKPVVL